MKISRREYLSSSLPEAREALRAFFQNLGFELGQDAEDRLSLSRPGRGPSWLGTRVERLPIRLEIRLSETRPDQTLATFEWDLRAPLHIVSRMDSLYFDLVNADAQHYLHTGICRDAADRLGHLRRPVMTAVFMNVIISTVLVVATGRMAGFPYWAIIVAALCVAFLNLGSILGFADLVIERVLALSVPGPSSSN